MIELLNMGSLYFISLRTNSGQIWWGWWGLKSDSEMEKVQKIKAIRLAFGI